MPHKLMRKRHSLRLFRPKKQILQARYSALQEELETQKRNAQAIAEITRAVSQLADLDTTLRRVMESLQAVMPIDFFYISLYDTVSQVMHYPIMYDSEQFYTQEALPLNPETMVAQVLQNRQPILINRTQEQIEQRTNTTIMLGDTDRVSASLMIVPLPLGNDIIGVMSAQTYTRDVYTQAMCDLLIEAAYPIATAVNNARLYDLQQKRLNQLDSLYRMGQAVSQLDDLSGTLQNIFNELQNILVLDAFYILAYDPQTQMLDYLMMYDDGQFWQQSPIHINNTIFAASILLEGQKVLINRTAEEIAEMEADLAGRVGNRNRVSASIMAAPFRMGGDLLGMISAQSYTRNAFDDESLSLLNNASLQIGIALHNARLYETLRHELEEKQLAEAEIRKLNTDLEARVIRRTSELEAINKELESFTYSISHDLRAPLRAMNGYASLLLQDYSAALDEDAQYYLGRIVHNSTRMWQLVEDLLAFSRMGRKELHHRRLNLTHVLASVLDNMRGDDLLGAVQVELHDLPACIADESLLKQVFYNLIDNAVKYSSKKPSPKIEIYAETSDSMAWIFIKDNGIGFDMRYANQLFTVFQRLHSDESYQGTGVGLALVQRIITRLGGEVRAEAIPNQGATFSFSLPLDA